MEVGQDGTRAEYVQKRAVEDQCQVTDTANPPCHSIRVLFEEYKV